MCKKFNNIMYNRFGFIDDNVCDLTIGREFSNVDDIDTCGVIDAFYLTKDKKVKYIIIEDHYYSVKNPGEFVESYLMGNYFTIILNDSDMYIVIDLNKKEIVFEEKWR